MSQNPGDKSLTNYDATVQYLYPYLFHQMRLNDNETQRGYHIEGRLDEA